jgi:hypothetical protein
MTRLGAIAVLAGLLLALLAVNSALAGLWRPGMGACWAGVLLANPILFGALGYFDGRYRLWRASWPIAGLVLAGLAFVWFTGVWGAMSPFIHLRAFGRPSMGARLTGHLFAMISGYLIALGVIFRLGYKSGHDLSGHAQADRRDKPDPPYRPLH